METIRVNMTPCEDIKTIHASQNDNEGREWGFELHNNGDKIDSSSITDQLVFKAYEGGTEEILPTNGSTPTTSPFLGDIRYPQGLLTDQEFTYRQSPTESDGLAFVESIKGNTLVWNQLVENGDFSASSGWTGQFATVTISNNVASVSQDRAGDYVGLRKSTLQGLTGHKYLVVADVKSAKKTAIAFYLSNTYSSAYDIQANTRTVVHAIITVSNANTGGFNVYTNRKTELAEGDVVEFYHVMLFDLTQMGLDISNPSDFTSLFPLPYYAYNQGTLLSFNGEQIKTVGKNLLPLPIAETKNGITLTHNGDGSITLKGTATALTYFDFSTSFDSSKYAGCLFTCRKASQVVVSGVLCIISQSNRVAIQDLYIGNNEAEVQDNGEGLYFAIRVANGTAMPTDGYTLYPMLRMPNQDSTFEPYTSSTLSLPISTYFPNGMKGAGSVYDELTPSKAITRIGAVDLGTLDWGVSNETMYANLPGAYLPRTGAIVANAICPKYTTSPLNYVIAKSQDKILALNNGQPRVNVYDSAYTDATAFKTAMSGVYLFYELATPTETSFTTASLVTENAEIPLSNDDGVLIGKCTEQLSSESGFFDAKIKLADGDGECYSNKIQLHVERSPQ